MTDAIRNLDLEKLLFIDIETVSRNEDLEIGSLEHTNFRWKHRNKENDGLLPNAAINALYKRIAALDLMYNRIVCISVGYVKGTTFFYTALTGKQNDIVDTLWAMLNTGKYTPCTWNGIAFDFPTIRLKALEEYLETTLIDKYNDSGKKPWNITAHHLDLMEVVKGTFYYSSSLADSCMIAKIDSPKEKINGAGVTEEFYKNGVGEIAKYCNGDIKALAQLLCVMMHQRDFLEDFVDKTGKKVEVKVDKTIAGKIKNTGKFGKADANKIVKAFKTKDQKTKDQVVASIESLLLLHKNKTALKKDKIFTFLQGELLKTK